MIEFFASEPHFRAHLEPIAWALGSGVRWVARNELAPEGGVVVVASSRDLLAIGHRPAVLVEHGAGQTYVGTETGSYAGGERRGNVKLFICPSDRVADLNRRRYPASGYAVVGCPRLDRYAGVEPKGTEVAFSFHWPCPIAPEADTAFRHYRGALADVSSWYEKVIGHGHPRILRRITGEYRAAGIEPVTDIDEVFRRASVYVVDNSSTGFEAMVAGIPVVWMNAPWYRKDVEHGLRFWELADSGVQVDDPGNLIDAIDLALGDHPRQRERREEAVSKVYAYTDGRASERAAQAIEELQREEQWT